MDFLSVHAHTQPMQHADTDCSCFIFALIRFDCGSGTGKVREEREVILNQWNTLIVYRYRWDAWIQLNNGQRVQGRSKVNVISYMYIHKNLYVCTFVHMHLS